jgi:hypothetical protein
MMEHTCLCQHTTKEQKAEVSEHFTTLGLERKRMMVHTTFWVHATRKLTGQSTLHRSFFVPAFLFDILYSQNTAPQHHIASALNHTAF